MKNLRTEYLVVTQKSSSFCNSIRTFNNLLNADSDIEIKSSKLRYKNLEVDYAIRKSELPDKELRFFHLKFVCHQLEKIDEFDELLKTVRTIAYKTGGQVKILWDDIAFHYSVESYPLVNEIENLMRRLIIQFMITTVGVDWDKEALPKDVKETIKKKKSNDNAVTSILHETDFIQLADCLFKPYFTKDTELLYKQIERVKDITDLNLNELREFIPKSNWTRYFSSLVECEDTFLNKRWTELYDLRCLVAHNNMLRKTDYERIVFLINETKPKLQQAIDNLDKVTVPEEEKDNLAENMAANINSLYGEFIHWWRILEGELERLAPSSELKGNKRIISVRMAVGLLAKNNIINSDLAKEIDDLLRTRNIIVHGVPTMIYNTRNQFSEEDIGEIHQKIALLKYIVNKLQSI